MLEMKKAMDLKRFFEPTIGNYKDNDFVPQDQFKEYSEKMKVNAVCIN